MAQTRAVVIGGSLAGMYIARVLSDFFDKVVVIERDAYPEGVQDRPGVPPGRGFHNLLIRGRREYVISRSNRLASFRKPWSHTKSTDN